MDKILTPSEIVKKKESLIQQLAELLGGSDKAEIWLNAPHPFLGYQTP